MTTPGRWTLEPAEYWQVRALGAEALRIAIDAQAKAEQAQARVNALVATLAKKYGFDPTIPTFQLDDATLTLTVGPPQDGA